MLEKNKTIEGEKTLERLLKHRIETELKGLCLKISSQYITGLPDRVCLITGCRIFFAEIKTTKKKPTKIQLYTHNKLRQLGFRVEVIERAEQIEVIINDYKSL